MRNMVISLALGAGAIFASSVADAAPLTKGLAMLPNDNIENVRLVCDQVGRCYRTRGGRRVITQGGYGDSYGYAPGYYGGPGDGPGYYGGPGDGPGYYGGPGGGPGYYGGPGGGPGYYGGGYGPGVGVGIGPVGVGIGFGSRW